MTIPQAVAVVLEKLDGVDKETVTSYIVDLQTKLVNAGVAMDEDAPEQEPDIAVDDQADDDEGPYPPLYESGEDYDKAGDLKQEASDLKDAGDWAGALDKYTSAIQVAPPSALLYANRAVALLALNRPRAAERDCNEALKDNPDSAKALRTRGKARKAMEKWEDALKDLSASQQIDFDEGTVEDLKFLAEKHIELEKMEAMDRNKKEEQLRKKAADIKKAQQEAREEAAQTRGSAGGGMPAGGFPGGMPGMPGGMPPGMDALFQDPELMAAMQNPKVMAAFSELMSGPGGPMGLMSNPEKLQDLMKDPEVGPVLEKLMAKMGGSMGGGAGMPSGSAGHGDDEDDGIPNLDEMDGEVDLDNLPDVE